MSTTNIKLKRSSVPGKQPNTSILELGEVALNTYDGKIFIKKDDGAESIVVIQEVTEDNLVIDSSLLDNSTSNTLAGVIDDLDDAISTLSGGGLSQVASDSTLNGLGTVASPLSVANNGHAHTANNITDFGSSVNTAIDTRVTKSFVDSLNVDADTLDSLNSTQFLRSDENDSTSGSLSTQSLSSATTFQLASVATLDTNTTSLTTTAKTQIDFFVADSFSSGKLYIQAKDLITGETQSTELLVSHNGTTAKSTEYGDVYTSTASLASYSADLVGSNVVISATSTSGNLTQYTTYKTLISLPSIATGSFAWDSSTESPDAA